MDLAEFAFDFFRSGLDRRRVRDIRLDRNDAALSERLHLLQRGIQRFRPDVAHRDRHAGTHERAREAQAYSRRGAGDDRDLSRKVLHFLKLTLA